MPFSSCGLSRQQLRSNLRSARRSLSRYEQKLAASQVAQHLAHLPQIIRARHLAVYLPNDGELSPLPFVDWALQQGKSIYLPVLHPSLPRFLWLVKWQPRVTRLKPNRFGIAEPDLKGQGFHPSQRLPAWAIDLVCLPLVGFDQFGGRLGMGGGFYDQTFDRRRVRPRQPYLVGLAHRCQEVDQLPSNPWDVPLNTLVTPSGARHFR